MLVYLFVRLADRCFVGSLVCCLLLGWFVLFGVVYDRCVSFGFFPFRFVSLVCSFGCLFICLFGLFVHSFVRSFVCLLFVVCLFALLFVVGVQSQHTPNPTQPHQKQTQTGDPL